MRAAVRLDESPTPVRSARGSRSRGLRLRLAAAVLCALLTASLTAFVFDRMGDGVLLAGTTIEGMDVGGRRLEDAVSRLRGEIEDPLHVPVRVGGPGFDRLTTPWDLGMRVDVRHAARTALRLGREGTILRRLWRRLAGDPIALRARPTLRRGELESFVAEAGVRLHIDPVSAELDVIDGWVRVSPGRNGRDIDIEAAARELAAAARGGVVEVALPIRVIEPQVPTSSYATVVLVRAGENKLYLYENGVVTRTYAVATGAPAFPTPVGEFKVVNKRRNPKWVNPGSDWAKRMPSYIPPGPDNPLGSRAMDLNVTGIRIHGTPDAASIGSSVSHGCVRMHMSDAEDLFSRVAVGTPVVVVRT